MRTSLPVLLVLIGALTAAPLALGSYAVVQRTGAGVQLAWFGLLALMIAGILLVALLALIFAI